jgi:lycopene cyclase domain-containing protein
VPHHSHEAAVVAELVGSSGLDGIDACPIHGHEDVAPRGRRLDAPSVGELTVGLPRESGEDERRLPEVEPDAGDVIGGGIDDLEGRFGLAERERGNPATAGQLAVAEALGARHDVDRVERGLAVAVLVPTLYFCLIDRIAIGAGLWTISADHTTGLAVAGLPVEEAMFFLLTNTFAVQGLVMYMWLWDRVDRGYLGEWRVAIRNRSPTPEMER